MLSRCPTTPVIIARFLDMTKPTKTSYEASRSLRRRPTSHIGPRYPKICSSQVVVRHRKAWCDRGLIRYIFFNVKFKNSYHDKLAVREGIILQKPLSSLIITDKRIDLHGRVSSICQAISCSTDTQDCCLLQAIIIQNKMHREDYFL